MMTFNFEYSKPFLILIACPIEADIGGPARLVRRKGTDRSWRYEGSPRRQNVTTRGNSKSQAAIPSYDLSLLKRTVREGPCTPSHSHTYIRT